MNTHSKEDLQVTVTFDVQSFSRRFKDHSPKEWFKSGYATREEAEVAADKRRALKSTDLDTVKVIRNSYFQCPDDRETQEHYWRDSGARWNSECGQYRFAASY